MRLLIAEDEPDLLATLAKVLRAQGYAVDEALDGIDACTRRPRANTTMTGTNTYTGPTTIHLANLAIFSTASLGRGLLTIFDGGLRTTASLTLDRDIFINDSGVIDVSDSCPTTINGQITGDGIVKLGNGTLVLTGSNSQAQTDIEGGILSISSAANLGSARLIVSSVLETTQSLTLDNDISLGNSGVGTFLVDAGMTTPLTTSFSATSSALNDHIRFSDVYHLHGTATDTFVLQLSITSTVPLSFVAYLDPNTNEWVNAIDGNTGNNVTPDQQGFLGSFAAFQADYTGGLTSYIGAWGVDLTGGNTSVWAVLDHNSDFAVAPEPSTWALLFMSGIGGLLLRRRTLSRRA